MLVPSRRFYSRICFSRRSRFRPPVGRGDSNFRSHIGVGRPDGQAQHIVYLKDGTVLHGRVVTRASDGGWIVVFKSGAFYAVGDGVRAIIFSPDRPDPRRPGLRNRRPQGVSDVQREYPRPTRPTPTAGIFDPSRPDEWNARGERTLILRSPERRIRSGRNSLTLDALHVPARWD